MLKRFFLNERNMLWAIILNGLVIFLLSFPQIEKQNLQFYHFLDSIDHLFVVLFLLEALVKLKALSPRTYFKDGWNRFDFLIVIVSLPSLLYYFGLAIPHSSFLKILRLFRLVRLVRFIKFIPRMEMIMQGLTRAIKASVFVMLALLFLNFMLALFTTHFYGWLVPDYFGDPLISSYYIFQMFTVEGWNEIPNVVAQAAAENGSIKNPGMFAGLARFYFILIVLSGGIFGMSLANAVFVDEMTMDNNQELEGKIDALQQQMVELKEMIENKSKL